MTEYRTVKAFGSAEFTEKRSRFIGWCQPVQTQEEAVAFVENIRSRHWDATHNVYAYRLRDGQLQRYSDDGEPQRTAGMPVLDVLQKSNLVDVVVVATRYFGGILLGGGGLVRAYSHTSSIAVQAAGIVRMCPCDLMTVSCDYSRYGRLASLIPECGGVIDDTRFTEEVSLDFHMPPACVPLFEKRLADAANGQLHARKTGEKYFEEAVAGEEK